MNDNKQPAYLHTDIPEIATDVFFTEGDVVIGTRATPTGPDMLDVALLTYQIALRLGIGQSRHDGLPPLFHRDGDDNLLFECPLGSVLIGKRLLFLRGWHRFDSCVKGFNSLGLMAEQVRDQLKRYAADQTRRVADTRAFLASRRRDGGVQVFDGAGVARLSTADLESVPALDVALWTCFASRTIVCSTSSNMGITLHQVLRSLQQAQGTWRDETFTILNSDEGRLIIWCPDEQADFMNPEKTLLLRSLESERPALTTLRTYINRTQRDPGALRDALLCGGHFFPTNPQSRDELQNLLFVAMTNIAGERGVGVGELLDDPNVHICLESLGCRYRERKVVVERGIDAGIGGLMLPYLIMVEELIADDGLRAMASWNQASIGAALAAAVLADMTLRNPGTMEPSTRAELDRLFPRTSRFIAKRHFGRDVETRVHGVFDVANLQSLAQLLGVVVEKHQTGRGTAYVGLGSSSYSNGNRCYELLRDSIDLQGPFRGSATFHPATHTLNPFAQALIYAEDLHRALKVGEARDLPHEARVAFVMRHVRKPEPAGAAAMAGYLLARLDRGSLSLVEMAYMLRLAGFTSRLLLQFFNLPADEAGLNKFVQEAHEEGPFMGGLARTMFQILDWPLEKLDRHAGIERAHSSVNYRLHPLEAAWFDRLRPAVVIYLTGDNTVQPPESLVSELVLSSIANAAHLAAVLAAHVAPEHRRFDSTSLINRALARISRTLHAVDARVQGAMKALLRNDASRRARKISAQDSQH